MKTTHDIEKVQPFLSQHENADPNSIEEFARGHISQAYGFETVDGEKLVLRISSQNNDYLSDKYAYEKFGSRLLIPKIIDIGHFDEDSYYCVSERAEGNISDVLSDDEIQKSMSSIHDEFAKIFKTDISDTTGYGHFDLVSGNATYQSWKDVMQARYDDLGGEKLKQNAENIGLNPQIVPKFIQQYMANLPFASETRRLTHGDLGFDNLLIKNYQVTAVIDWAGIGYGDWMYDFAKLDFWWPNRFGDAREFALKYDLEYENLEQRNALYWARSALSIIQWSDENNKESIKGWLRQHVEDRLV